MRACSLFFVLFGVRPREIFSLHSHQTIIRKSIYALYFYSRLYEKDYVVILLASNCQKFKLLVILTTLIKYCNLIRQKVHPCFPRRTQNLQLLGFLAINFNQFFNLPRISNFLHLPIKFRERNFNRSIIHRRISFCHQFHEVITIS